MANGAPVVFIFGLSVYLHAQLGVQIRNSKIDIRYGGTHYRRILISLTCFFSLGPTAGYSGQHHNGQMPEEIKPFNETKIWLTIFAAYLPKSIFGFHILMPTPYTNYKL